MQSTTVKQAQSSGKLTILFDSGIRSGPDVLKALALGAQAVLCKCFSPARYHEIGAEKTLPQVGRPWLYGMTVGGQAGVEQVLKHTLADVDTTLGLIGRASLKDVQGKGEEVIMKLDL